MTDYPHQMIATNGIRLHVVQAGPPDGPLVILLHGFPEFWYGWKKQMNDLAERGFRGQRGEERFHGGAPKGTVLEQTPAAGSHDVEGTVVTLVVSAGQNVVQVPVLLDDRFYSDLLAGS